MLKSFLVIFWAATLLAAGSTHGGAISVIRVPNGGIQPQAVMDANGTLHLLYYAGERMHGDLFYVKSSDAGVTWSRPLRVNSEPGTAIARGSIRGGQMAIAPGGLVHVAWNGSAAESEQPGAPMLYSRINESRTAFEKERNLMTHTFGLDGGGSIAADPSGVVYVSWHASPVGAAAGEEGRKVWLAKSTDNGKTFSAEEPAWKEQTGACGCCGMAMFWDSQGTLRELYRSATGNIHRDIYMLASQDHGNSFSGRKLDTWEINACPMTSMSFAEGPGKVEAAWETAGQVFFENISTAQAAPVSAPGESKGHKHPRIAISPNGSTLMAWTEGTSFTSGGSLAWQLYDATGKAVGEKASTAGLPAFSFGAVVAKPVGFTIIY
jgi:hypothetical protein